MEVQSSNYCKGRMTAARSGEGAGRLMKPLVSLGWGTRNTCVAVGWMGDYDHDSMTINGF